MSSLSTLIASELVATCNALGHTDELGAYQIYEYTFETIRDIIRYLRRDNETHEIRRFLGQAKILQNDLLPIFQQHYKDDHLFDILLRLLVNLTNPGLLVYNNEIPREKKLRSHYLKLICYLQDYKRAFSDEKIWKVLSWKLSELLSIEWQERSEDQGITIERVLILIRNVLQVPVDLQERTVDANMHDKVLWSLYQSGMVDIFVYLATSENEHTYYMHVLEIISLMLREQSPAQLADSALSRSAEQKDVDERELLAIKQKENYEKAKKKRVFTGSRHSRFGGTFVIKNMKSLGNNDLICHKPLNRLSELNFDITKTKVKPPKNRMPMKENGCLRQSPYSVRLFLKEFCIEILNGAYNTLMYNVKSQISAGRAQEHDESFYLWSLRFFMEFNRCYKFDLKLVSETMSVQTFHFVQQQIEAYFDCLRLDRKKPEVWSRRLHLGLRAYRELLSTLLEMEKCRDRTLRDTVDVIKTNIFYTPEYRELVLTMMMSYNELKMSRAYLNDLIETQHVFLKLLEASVKSRTLVVQKYVRGGARKKQAKSKKPQKPKPAPLDLERVWSEIGPLLTNLMEGAGDTVKTDIMPFDAGSDLSMDQQKTEAMCQIQRLLRKSNIEEGLALLRECRHIWPENDSFGSQNLSIDDEYSAVKDIFFADIQDESKFMEDEQQSDESDEENEEGAEHSASARVREADFDFKEFADKFAHPKIIQACALALKSFETNTSHINHCIVKLLHRICWDSKMYPMLFQASVFRAFQRIFAKDDLTCYKELSKFATFIVGKFVDAAHSNPKIYMELLFWKNGRDAYDIMEGYGSYHEKTQATQRIWNESQEDELRILFMEHQRENIQQDVGDWISNRLVDATRTRKSIMRKLKELNLLIGKEATKAVRVRLPKTWSDDEIEQLKRLFEEHRRADDPLKGVLDNLHVRRPRKQVVEKLLELGLVGDRTELRKKRVGQRGGKSGDGGEEDSDGREMDSESDNSASDSEQRVISRFSSHSESKPGSKIKRNKFLSMPTVIEKILKVKELGLVEALEWIKESLTDAAEDITEEGEQFDDVGVAIVPITQAAFDAMNEEKFTEMLVAMRIFPPEDEQSTYWKLSANSSPLQLREMAKYIDQAIDGTLVASDSNPDQNESDFDHTLVNDDEENDGNTQLMLNDDLDLDKNVNKKRKQPINRLIFNDSDSEPEFSQIPRLEFSQSSRSGSEKNVFKKKIGKSKKRGQMIDSDSSDSENLSKNGANNDDSDGSLKLSLDSPSKNKNQKKILEKKKLLDVDSDSDNQLDASKKLQKSVKTNKTLDSDFSAQNSKISKENVDRNVSDHSNEISFQPKKTKKSRKIRQFDDSDSDDSDLKVKLKNSPKVSEQNQKNSDHIPNEFSQSDENINSEDINAYMEDILNEPETEHFGNGTKTVTYNQNNHNDRKKVRMIESDSDDENVEKIERKRQLSPGNENNHTVKKAKMAVISDSE